MVAISLYRGNLHRVPDIPRRWLMPNPQISPKNFKSLLLRRSKALSLLPSTASDDNRPNPNSNSLSKPKIEPSFDNVSPLGIQSEALKVIDNGEGPSGKDQVHQESKKPVDDGPGSLVDSKTDLPGKASEPVDGAATSTENQVEPVSEACVSLIWYNYET